ncbi:RT0821/Lpp0805 family surface protein [Roseibium aestuarii]|uniref:RT0821/Lpp0805 family surface protein n=1 Tax=Roseibium aestuarii TaxID=2600299 RepID=A0ABW4JSR3_9HYPH|nr:RT0821/Lpp0805 family surface protein [Roseibium aestuarii]
MAHRFSYTPFKAKIQWLSLVALFAGSLTGGCSQISVPLGSSDVETPMVLTGSLPSSSDQAFADIEDGDRAVITATLAQIIDAPEPSSAMAYGAGAPAPQRFSWTNPLTGNSGSLSGIDQSQAESTGCVAFKTTANTIAGVRLYSGIACKDVRQQLTITSLTVEAA